MRPLAALLVLAACGDNIKPPAPDAPGSTSGDVMVTTYVRAVAAVPEGTAQAMVHVLVVQPDGTPGDDALTDAQGNATLHGVFPGAAVSAVYPDVVPMTTEVTSILGAAPGDQLTFGDGYQRAFGAFVGTMSVDAPTFAGAVDYGATTLCGSSTLLPLPPIEVDLTAACETANGPIALFAYDPGLLPIASGFLPDGPLSPTLDVPLSAWTPNSTVTTTLEGIDPQVMMVELDSTAAYAAGVTFTAPTMQVPIGDGAASFSNSMPMTAPRMVGHAILSAGGHFGIHEVYRALPGTATTLTLATPSLPWVSALAADPGVGRAVWLQTSGTYDAAVLSLSWPLFDGGIEHDYAWTVILPPGTTSFDFSPALGASLPLDGGIVLTAGLLLIDVPTVPSYDALRALPEWQIADPADAVMNGDLPALGLAQPGVAAP